jgi:hypothetical protein
MIHEAGLDKYLRLLNELLVRERDAITQLQMHRLAAIQQEKTTILKKIAESEKCAGPECHELAASIQENNRRNRWLLQSGLHMVDKLQQDVHRRLALTYAPHGRALHIDAGPRILNQRS